jgi:hypothetical protein
MQVSWAACARTMHGFCEKVTYSKLFAPSRLVQRAARGDANDGGGPSSANGGPPVAEGEQVEDPRPQWLYMAGRPGGEGAGEDEDEDEGNMDDVYTSGAVAQSLDFIRKHLRVSRTKGRQHGGFFLARRRLKGAPFGHQCESADDLCRMVRCRPTHLQAEPRHALCAHGLGRVPSHPWLDELRAAPRPLPPAVHGWTARALSHPWLDDVHTAARAPPQPCMAGPRASSATHG